MVSAGWSNTAHGKTKPFCGKVISLKTDLWGYLKDRVYSSKPRTIAELKYNFKSELKKLDKETCKNVIKKFTEFKNVSP